MEHCRECDFGLGSINCPGIAVCDMVEDDSRFKSGDKIVCISAGGTDLDKGDIYVIQDYNKGMITLEGKNGSTYYEDRFIPYDKKPKEDTKKTFHSSHYESDSIEPIEFMMSNKLDFCRSSIVKYAFRAGKKNGQETLDIKKIIDYALLLAIQENIPFTKDDAQDIIDYRFDWSDKR